MTKQLPTGFRMTVTYADGTTSTGTATEAHTRASLTRAVSLGLRVEATRRGGVIITRDLPDGRTHTVTYLLPAPIHLSETVRRDLGLIALRGGRMKDGRIITGLFAIPPAAAARLARAGLVAVQAGQVSVSLAGRLALHAVAHTTGTRQPRGYVRPADVGLAHLSAGLNKPGGRAGKIHDRTSSAWCSCRAWSAPFAEDRADAGRRARGHREEATAAMIRALNGDTPAAEGGESR